MNVHNAMKVPRRLGAIVLLVVGGVHLKEYTDGYAEIATIGVLFLLNFVAATLLSLVLLLPTERLVPRWGALLVRLSALAGIGLSIASLAMLEIAERRPLFGFMEPGFHPEMIRLARFSEAISIVLLGGFLLAHFFRSRRRFSTDVGTTRPRKSEGVPAHDHASPTHPQRARHGIPGSRRRAHGRLRQ